jgi:hypothetical protein
VRELLIIAEKRCDDKARLRIHGICDAHAGRFGYVNNLSLGETPLHVGQSLRDSHEKG